MRVAPASLLSIVIWLAVAFGLLFSVGGRT
jgi:hypothetical protein